MLSTGTQSTCLNCGAELHGAFCSRCGQRSIAPYPTLRELIGDSWQELSGYDGRFARTVRMLLRRPGALTLEVLEGRRARYVSPVRLYLLASLVYFVVAAATPKLLAPEPPVLPGSTLRIDLRDPVTTMKGLSPERRQEALAAVERAPWALQPILRSAIVDPVAFRERFVTNLPRTVFALVPVFAAIAALFYRRRPFSQHLVFALHLHAAMFIALSVAALANFTHERRIAGAAAAAAWLFVAAYAVAGFRRVYRETWAWILAKSVSIAVLYVLAALAALVLTIVWVARA